jgi:hypothetical protein
MASYLLNDIEFINFNVKHKSVVILGNKEVDIDKNGLGVYDKCNNVIGVIDYEELRRMVLRAIPILATYDDTFASLLEGDDNPEDDFSDDSLEDIYERMFSEDD